jgi:hypothetical protein
MLDKVMNDDPQAGSRRDLKRFYVDLVINYGWTHVSPLVDALDALLSMRDARGLFSFTSHEVLVFSRHPAYPAWADDYVVAITPLRSGQVEVAHFHRRDPRGIESRVVSYAELITTVDSLARRLIT